VLEDRRLLSGGLIQSLLAVPLPSLLLRLTPAEVAAVLQQGKSSLGAAAGTSASNSGGVTANAVGSVNVDGIAAANVKLNMNLLQPGGSLLAFAASGWGTSGIGTLFSLGARGSVNPTQGLTGGGGAEVGLGGLFDFSRDFGLGSGGNQRTGFGEGMGFPGAGAFSEPGSLAFPNLFTTGQSNLETAKADSSAPQGIESPVETTDTSVQESGAAGSDGKSLSPQSEDLQDATSSSGPLGLLFQRLLDQVGDFGHGLSSWLGNLSWVSWSVGIALAAAACAGTRRKWRRGQSPRVSLVTSKETVEPWWFPGLR
jgi:hypothetical protein